MNTRWERAGRAPRARSGAMIGLAIAWAPMGAGCVAPEKFDAVSKAQRDAMVRLEVAHAADAAAMRAMAGALLSAQRERLLTRLETELVGRYITGAGEADEHAIDAAIDAPPGAGAPGGLLIAEVREGRSTREEAKALVRDYAAAEALSTAQSHRRALLAGLGPVARHDEATAAILAALDARSADTSALFADALASAGAIRDALGAGARADETTRAAALAIWRDAVATNLTTQGAKDAGERLLGAILGGN